MSTLAFVGLDVSQDDAKVCFLLADGAEPSPRWTIANTQPGAEALIAELARLCQAHGITRLRIGVEATGLLWWHLASALRDAPAPARLTRHGQCRHFVLPEALVVGSPTSSQIAP